MILIRYLRRRATAAYLNRVLLWQRVRDAS